MDFQARNTQPEKQRTACAVVGVFENRRQTDSAKAIDKATSSAVTKAIRRGDMGGKLGQSVVLHNLDGVSADRVLLVGCGKHNKVDDARFRKAITAAILALANTGARDAVSYLNDVMVDARDEYWKSRQVVEGFRDRVYRFNQMKSVVAKPDAHLRRVTINASERSDLPRVKDAVAAGVAISSGVDLAKDLGNLPANVCTPTYLADKAKQLAGDYPALKVRVLSEADMKRLGMGSLLSVSRGSREPAKLISMQYSGGPKGQAPVVLVGKGVTFDSGGISIKPAGAMDEMKFDMCGAASVFGSLRAVVELELPINVVGLVPATENLPDGAASKPGDIVTSMSGKTIEVLNTDAEGRLILCDALTYAERFEPDVVIDIATLTGACVIALGSHASGLFSNNTDLTGGLLDAGRYSGDRTWEMPLWDEYQDQLKSNFADIANVGGREGGAITAACFLSRFTRDLNWAHLDIAGAAWLSGARKGSTGRPVKLLTQFIMDKCG